jgi:hypothetical protein
MTVTPVMFIREVRMGMRHRFMLVGVGMLCPRRHRMVMNVLMVFVVAMFMTMFHRIVYVGMFMALGQV